MPGLFIVPRYIQLLRPAPEPFPAERLSIYRWLAVKLLAATEFQVDWPKTSICISSEQLAQPLQDEITHLLALNPVSTAQARLEIVDFADNPYHLLTDIFLYEVAKISQYFIEHRLTDSRVVILLPLLPPEDAIFWRCIQSLHNGTNRPAPIVVLANDGKSWPPGRLDPADQRSYRSKVSHELTLVDMLVARTVTRIGHYALGSEQRPRCTTRFFDTEAAGREITELAVRWAIENGISGEGYTLIAYSRRGAAEKFHRAILDAATTLGCKFDAAPSEKPREPVKEFVGQVVLIFDVIDGGHRFRQEVERLRSQRIAIANRALTIIRTTPQAPLGQSLPQLDAVCSEFTRQSTSARHCLQCALGLPHTVGNADSIGIRTVDMWGLLTECPWKKETFGPSQRRWLSYAPDMAWIFDRYGDWMSYKISKILSKIGLNGDIVFICPNEPHTARLVARLGTIMQNSQVTVTIPRRVLESKELVSDIQDSKSEAWHLQLSYLRQRQDTNIVIIDEFTRSYSTANAIIELLAHDAFRLRAKANIPIVDFAISHNRRPRFTYSLYNLPYPVSGDLTRVQPGRYLASFEESARDACAGLLYHLVNGRLAHGSIQNDFDDLMLLRLLLADYARRSRSLDQIVKNDFDSRIISYLGAEYPHGLAAGLKIGGGIDE